MFVRLHDNVTALKAFDRSQCANLGLERLAGAKGESFERQKSKSAASITSHLGKTDVVLLSVSESSDPGHNRLFCCRVAEDVRGFFEFMFL